MIPDGWFSFPDPSNILELGVTGDPNNDFRAAATWPMTLHTPRPNTRWMSRAGARHLTQWRR